MEEMVVCLASAAAAGVLMILLLRALLKLRLTKKACLGFGLPLAGLVILFVFTLDTVPPHTFALAPHGWQRTSPIVVRLIATDDGWGVRSTTYRIDNGGWITGTRARVTNEGTHTVAFYSTDRMGNREPKRTATVRIDTMPPVTTDNTTPWERGNVVIALAAEDTASGVASTKYSLDGGPWRSGNAVPVNGDGPHVVKYHSTDRAGNREAIYTRSFWIDNGRPVTFAPEAVTVGQGYWTTIPFSVADVTPFAHVRVRITGPHSETRGPVIRHTNRLETYRFRCLLPPGTYSYTVEATDQAGNHAAQVGSNTLRKPPPVITTVAATVDDPFPTMNEWVTASCQVTDQYGNPVSGAAVTFTWNYLTVTDVDTAESIIPGTYQDMRSISHATSGYRVVIDVSVTLGSQTAAAVTGFTPQ